MSPPLYLLVPGELDEFLDEEAAEPRRAQKAERRAERTERRRASDNERTSPAPPNAGC